MPDVIEVSDEDDDDVILVSEGEGVGGQLESMADTKARMDRELAEGMAQIERDSKRSRAASAAAAAVVDDMEEAYEKHGVGPDDEDLRAFSKNGIKPTKDGIRSWRRHNHPDKGGDTAEFQKTNPSIGNVAKRLKGGEQFPNFFNE
jgi:hypothetical protein